MRKGGYKLIDMNGFDFAASPSSPNIEIYNNLNTNFNKVLLISNWYVNGVLMNDVFTTLISNDNGYQFTIHTEDNDYTYSINNTGAITLTTKSNHLYLYRFSFAQGEFYDIYTTQYLGTSLDTVTSRNFLINNLSGKTLPLLGYNYLNVIAGSQETFTFISNIQIGSTNITQNYFTYNKTTNELKSWGGPYNDTINGTLFAQIY